MDSATYTESSRLQAAGLLPAVTLFERAAAQVPLPAPPQPIVIAALFRTLADDPDSYLHHDPASFTSAIGRSFYSQLLPTNTVDLGWTSWAVQWLSRLPAPLHDHVQVAYSKNEQAREAYALQAATDWQNFLAFRGRELCPQGRLVVLTMAIGDDGEFGYRPFNDALVAALHDQARDGLLRRDELLRMAFPVVARTEKEFRAPFSPKGRFAGLTIEHLEVFNAEDRFWARFQLDGDADVFGAQWAAFARAALFPTLVTALDGGSTTREGSNSFSNWRRPWPNVYQIGPSQCRFRSPRLCWSKANGASPQPDEACRDHRG